jgi:hypothetical protein
MKIEINVSNNVVWLVGVMGYFILLTVLALSSKQ